MHDMFDGFWSGVIGALLSTRRGGPPTPAVYLVTFLVGALSAIIILFISIAWDVGLAKAFSLIIAKFLSPVSLLFPLFGGLMATSVFWSPTSDK